MAVKVYVVIHGKQNEGGGVVSIHRFRGTARKAALLIKCCFESGWEEEAIDYWTNGCDFVRVELFKVQP